MSMHSTSKRVVVGGVAAAAGLATVAAPLVTDVAGASGSDGDTPTGAATPQALPAPGTYESCTAYFGLSKGNSDLVSYEVRTQGPVAPDPVIGTNLIPILTVQTSGGEVQCIPEAGWTDLSSWQTWIDDSDPVFTYPGTGYNLVPRVDGTFDTTAGVVTVSSTSIRFETDIQATVTWAPGAPPATENGWRVLDGPTLSPTSPGVAETLQRIADAGGSTDAVDVAASFLVGPADLCSDPPAGALTSLADALSVLFDTTVSSSCFELEIDTGILYRSSLFDVMVADSLIVVTLSNPTPTTTSGAVAGDAAVAPTFTG